MVTVSPAYIYVVVPAPGTPHHETVKINNPSEKRLTFKVKGTKLEMFDVVPPYGFVLAKSSVHCKIRPRFFEESELSRHDHFTVLVAYAPEGENDVKKAWLSAKNVKKFSINIHYIPDIEKAPPNKGTKAEEQKSDEQSSSDDDKPPPKKSSSIKKSERNTGKAAEKPKPTKTKTASPVAVVDDEKTAPPEELNEVPEFQEFFHRHYD